MLAKELINWPTNIDDPRLDLGISKKNVPTKIWYQWKLYKLLEILNPKDFNPSYNIFCTPRIYWYKHIEDAITNKNEKYVGSVRTTQNETLYITISDPFYFCFDFSSGFFTNHSNDGFSYNTSNCDVINQLKCANPEVRNHLERYFWKEIIKAYYGEAILKIRS